MSFHARILDPEALREVSPIALRAYAEAQGWQKGERFGEFSDIYTNQVGSGNEAIIPGTSKVSDYARVISALVSLFAKVEERGELEVYRDLVTADQDVVRVRIPEAGDDGSVGLQTGAELIAYSREMLLSAACSATDPRPAYRAGSVLEAADYLDHVRLGQTERGSYIVTLLSPVSPSFENIRQINLWPNPTDEPFERQVTRKLVGGLMAARDSIVRANRGDGFQVFESAVKEGVSANLCEAVANLIEIGSGLDVSVTWARTRFVPERRRTVSFSPSDAPVLKEAARRFRDREPRPDEKLLGYIVHLDRDNDEQNGRIRLRTMVGGRVVSVRMELPKEQYETAIRAHDDQSLVTVIGDLVREGHRWRMLNPHALSQLDPEDEVEA